MPGGPGSGKGTQSLKIAERYGFQYISVGELLRKKIHSASSNRKWSLIAKIITNGELAPQVSLRECLSLCKKIIVPAWSTPWVFTFVLKETTITEIKQKLMQIPDEEGIVIDGFPRDVAQALSFEDQVRISSCILFASLSSLVSVPFSVTYLSISVCAHMFLGTEPRTLHMVANILPLSDSLALFVLIYLKNNLMSYFLLKVLRLSNKDKQWFLGIVSEF